MARLVRIVRSRVLSAPITSVETEELRFSLEGPPSLVEEAGVTVSRDDVGFQGRGAWGAFRVRNLSLFASGAFGLASFISLQCLLKHVFVTGHQPCAKTPVRITVVGRELIAHTTQHLRDRSLADVEVHRDLALAPPEHRELPGAVRTSLHHRFGFEPPGTATMRTSTA